MRRPGVFNLLAAAFGRLTGVFGRLAVLAAFLAAGCDMPWRVAGGSGTETSNGEIVAGRVFGGDGHPASGAFVHVRPAGYLKDTLGIDSAGSPAPADAITDKDGYFRLKSLAPGSYKAEIKDGKGMALLLGFDLTSQERALELLPDTLRRVGILQGVARLAPGMSGPMYVQVYGLDRLVRTNDTGFFVIPDLPAGQIRFRVVSSTPGTSYAAPALAVITPGATVTADSLEPITFANEDYAEWPFSRRIFINTEAAPIGDTVTDFPLLVRLDAHSFDFDLSDGKDLRFSARDGRHLPYQLDSWDAVNRNAAFWVKLDTVLDADRTQYITMHYGRRDAPDFSDGKSVFSTFGGVWHFSETVDADGEGTFPDASPSRATGLARIYAKDRQGTIGPGAGFRGTHRVIAPATAPALRPARTLTLSAWAFVSGSGAQGGEFASMGDNYGMRTTTKGNAHFFLMADTSVHDPAWRSGNSFQGATTGGLDMRGAWHLVTARYDGVAMKVFVDGVEKASAPLAKDIHYPFHKEFWMGQHGNGDNPNYVFHGWLDEVQMSPVVRSPAWIRLSFLSQQIGSTLLEFR